MNNKFKNLHKIIILSLFPIISLLLGLFIGYNDNTVSSFFNIFEMTNKIDIQILELLRIPRVIKATVAGVCLALAGMFIQSVSKNPLAEPYITGISSGAALGIIISILIYNGMNYSFFGFLGALTASIVVILLTGINKFSITKLILVGLSVNIFTGALISLLILLNPEKSYIMMLILSGGITDDSIISTKLLCVMFLVAILISLYCVPKLNFLRLDENMVFQSKYKKNADSILIIIISAILTAISVFSAGIIGFVGIIAPQISKILFGEDYRWLFVSNILLGSSLILTADFLSRTLVYPFQLPLGLVVSIIGAPVFVYFLVKKKDIFND